MNTAAVGRKRRNRPPEGLHAPKPITPLTRLGKVLLALEIEPCECAKWRRRQQGNDGQEADTGTNRPNPDGPLIEAMLLSPPCYHTETCGHSLPFAAWLRLLKAHDPASYAEPPPPAEAMSPLEWADRPCPRRGARVDAYHARAAAGVGLYHPDDNADAGGLLAWARGALSEDDAPDGPPCRGLGAALGVARHDMPAALALLAEATRREAAEPWAAEALAEARARGKARRERMEGEGS